MSDSASTSISASPNNCRPGKAGGGYARSMRHPIRQISHPGQSLRDVVASGEVR
jgi:hypothetical protein